MKTEKIIDWMSEHIFITSVIAFAGYILLTKAASDYGDRHFPRERFLSDDFWNWKQ